MNTTTDKPIVQYNEALEDKFMYMSEDELFRFFNENTVEYKEELIDVVMRFHNEGI